MPVCAQASQPDCRWLARRLAPLPKWAGLSSLGIGLLAFVVLAVVFGFFLDQSDGM